LPERERGIPVKFVEGDRRDRSRSFAPEGLN
jgi:hypothetical protein